MIDSKSGQLVLGRYRVVRRLTQGGMGVVYLGRVEGDAGFAKAVVIKRILQDIADVEEHTAQFIREAQILSHLQHPGIVGVLDFGRSGDGYSMVLEYVHGYDLARWLKYLHGTSQRMHWEEAVLIAVRVLEALHYAHTFRTSDDTAACVLHRDISPGNILLDLEGRVRLLDFGIARMAHGDSGECKTEAGVLKGKVGFLAPEIFALSPATTASDVYACGVVLYQMLTGSHPFAADDQRQLMFRAISEEPRHITERCPDVPAALDAAVLEALAKKPELRPRSAEAFAEKLRKTLTRSEADIFIALRERLRRDFSGDMPSKLKLEPLHVREKAWREEQRSSQIEPAPLSSSSVPNPVHTATTARPPRARKAGAKPARARRPEPEAADADPTATSPRDMADAEPTATSAVASPPTRAPKLHLLRGIGIGAAVTAVLAGAALMGALLLSQRQAPAATAGRFIVVESPDTAGKGGAPVVATAEAEPARDGAEPAPETGAASPTPARVAQPARESAGTSLSRQLARRRPELESCFKRFASELEGRPEISVHFEVAASGRVSSARLSPEAINGTPLGQCLLAVARATEFGPQPHAVGFSIPLVARTVQ